MNEKRNELDRRFLSRRSLMSHELGSIVTYQEAMNAFGWYLSAEEERFEASADYGVNNELSTNERDQLSEQYCKLFLERYGNSGRLPFWMGSKIDLLPADEEASDQLFNGNHIGIAKQEEGDEGVIVGTLTAVKLGVLARDGASQDDSVIDPEFWVPSIFFVINDPLIDTVCSEGKTKKWKFSGSWVFSGYDLADFEPTLHDS